MRLLQMSIQAGILIVIIALLRSVMLHRLPKAAFLSMWGVALLRLLVPVEYPFSAYQILDCAGIKVSFTSQHMQPSILNTNVSQIATTVQEAPKTRFWVVVWLSGLSILAILFLIGYWRNIQIKKRSRPIADEKQSLQLQHWLNSHKTLRQITILQCEDILSPVTFGIFKPCILLPSSLKWDDTAFFVLQHEYCHIRRYDAVWKLVLIVAVCIHWFNPMVWIMLLLVTQDLEISCDEMVLRCFGAEVRKHYAYAIISMAAHKCGFSGVNHGFSKNAVEERIVSIMKYKRFSWPTIALAVVLVAGTTTVFAQGKTPMETTVVNAIEDSSQGSQDSNTEIQKPSPEYQDFGISYAENGDMLYQGKLVRCFFDGYEIDEGQFATKYGYYNENGMVNVHTIRDIIDNRDGSYNWCGKLRGIKEYTEQELKQNNIESLVKPIEKANVAVATTTDNSQSGGSQGKTFTEIFKAYQNYGIVYQELYAQDDGRTLGRGDVYYQGELVKHFIDEKPDGGIFTYDSYSGGAITVQTVYDEAGKMTGIQKVK